MGHGPWELALPWERSRRAHFGLPLAPLVALWGGGGGERHTSEAKTQVGFWRALARGTSWGTSRHVFFISGKRDLKKKSAPSTVRPLARNLLRVLIGWLFPLGFGMLVWAGALTLHRALHDGRPGFPGADGRLPIRPRCGRVYDSFHSFMVWAGACYWHGVGGFMFSSSPSGICFKENPWASSPR